MDLPDHPEYVLPGDRPHVEAFNRRVGDNHRLDLQLLPEPFLGPRRARLVLLTLNPGWAETDRAVHRDRRYASALRANLSDDPGTQRHLGLSSEFSDRLPWWTTRCFGEVIRQGHEGDALANKVLVVEFHGYHSVTYTPIPVTLPSQRFSFWLVERAIDRQATIVLMRGARDWEVAVPQLHGYPQLVQLANPRSGSLSPRNCPDGGFGRVLAALEHDPVP